MRQIIRNVYAAVAVDDIAHLGGNVTQTFFLLQIH